MDNQNFFLLRVVYNQTMAKFPKITFKNLLTLFLLIVVTGVMNVVGRLIGGKTPISSAEAQCWTSGSGSSTGSVCESTDSGAPCTGAGASGGASAGASGGY